MRLCLCLCLCWWVGGIVEIGILLLENEPSTKRTILWEMAPDQVAELVECLLYVQEVIGSTLD